MAEKKAASSAMVIVVCGVAGSGKTTVGMEVAKLLNVPFHDADSFHSKGA
jgi:shikimate kinase